MTLVTPQQVQKQIPHHNHGFMAEPEQMKVKRWALQNHLLDALPTDVYERLVPHLELMPMKLGDVLYESGGELRYVYFPMNCIITLLYIMENGSSSEIAMVGNEGMVGVALLMGGDTMPNRAVIQTAGYAYRLKKHVLEQEINRNGTLLRLLLLYTQALITQMAQTAACNRHHSLDQQLCRWLLLSLDRLNSEELTMTQELIANMLGVRREGVTEAAQKLQKAGLIAYSRGHITVLDRPGLEARACECYQVVKTEFERLLPLPTSLKESHNILKMPTMKGRQAFKPALLMGVL